MITTFLVPALVLTLGGDHAAYHPKDTNFYLEVPDVSGALEAYKEAPLIKLFEDPELQGFLGMVLEKDPEEVNLPHLSGLLLEQLRSELPDVGLGVLDLVMEVNNASISIAGVDLNGLFPLVQEAEQGDLDPLLERLGEMGATFVIDFREPANAEEAENLIRSQLLELAINSAPAPPDLIDGSREQGTKLDLTEYNLDEDDHPLFVTVIRAEERLTVTLGLSSNLFPIHDESRSLAANENFQRAGKHWMGSDGTTILNSYFSISGVAELVELLDLIPDCPPQVVDATNYFLDVTMPGGEFHMRTRTHLAGGQFHSESFTLQPGLDPKNQLMSSEPITRESFRMAPPDAVGVSAFNLNKSFLAETLMRGLVTMTGDEEQHLLADFKESYDVHPVHALIGSLGGSAMTYTLPYTTIGQPKVFMALDLEDSQEFARGLEALGDFAIERSDGMIGVHSKPYRKHPLVTFSPGKALMQELFQSMGEAAPAFIQMNLVVAVTPDRAIISSSAIYTKRELKRLMKADPSDRHALMDQATDLPAGIHSYGTTDWGSMISGGYDSVRGFLPLIVSGAGVDLPFDLADMPSGDLFQEYFQPSVLWSRRVEDGTYAHGVSSFGPELPFLAGAGVGAGMVIGLRAEQEAKAWPPATAQTPMKGRSQSDKDLMAAIQLYKAEHNHLPAKLEDLAIPTPNFPEGFLGGRPVPTNVTYTVNESGHGYQLERTVSRETIGETGGIKSGPKGDGE